MNGDGEGGEQGSREIQSAGWDSGTEDEIVGQGFQRGGGTEAL